MLKLKGNAADADKDQFNHEYALIPEAHRDLIEQEIKEIVVDPGGNSRYDRTKGFLYLAPGLVEGEVVHEMAHVLEIRLDIFGDERFIQAVRNTIGEIDPLEAVIPDNSFAVPIEIPLVDDHMQFNIHSLGDFSVRLIKSIC